MQDFLLSGTETWALAPKREEGEVDTITQDDLGNAPPDGLNVILSVASAEATLQQSCKIFWM